MALPNDPAPTPTITYSAVNSGTTLCTKLVPFRLRVHFDDGEVRTSLDTFFPCSSLQFNQSKSMLRLFREFGIGHSESEICSNINILVQVISSDSSKVCGTSSSAARTADTTDECATFRLYGSRKVSLGAVTNDYQ